MLFRSFICVASGPPPPSAWIYWFGEAWPQDPPPERFKKEKGEEQSILSCCCFMHERIIILALQVQVSTCVVAIPAQPLLRTFKVPIAARQLAGLCLIRHGQGSFMVQCVTVLYGGVLLKEKKRTFIEFVSYGLQFPTRLGFSKKKHALVQLVYTGGSFPTELGFQEKKEHLWSLYLHELHYPCGDRFGKKKTCTGCCFPTGWV